MNTALPAPTFQVNNVVRYRNDKDNDRRWFLRRLVRHLIRETRKYQGPGGKLHSNHKVRIRSAIDRVMNATRMVVAGVVPTYSICCGISPAHIAYLKGIPGAAAGVQYIYHICFISGSSAYIPDLPMAGSYTLEVA